MSTVWQGEKPLTFVVLSQGRELFLQEAGNGEIKLLQKDMPHFDESAGLYREKLSRGLFSSSVEALLLTEESLIYLECSAYAETIFCGSLIVMRVFAKNRRSFRHLRWKSHMAKCRTTAMFFGSRIFPAANKKEERVISVPI